MNESILQTPAGTVALVEEGAGSPVLFVHGSPGGPGTHPCVWTDPTSDAI